MDAKRYADLRADGWSRGKVEYALSSGTLRRVARGALLTGGPGQPTIVDLLRALFLVLPPAAVLGFHTAAELYGFGVMPGRKPHIVVPAGTPVPDLRGVASRQAVLPVGEPVEVAGLPCVPPERCAIDLARTCRRLDAIAVLDAALRSGRCTPESLAAEVARHDGLRGVRQARELVPFADPRAECRQESQLRLVLVDGRLATPEPQLWVADEWGEPRYRLDLGYEELRVAGEYDGSSHLDRHRMRSDRQRHNWLASRGWVMRYFTDADLYRRQPYIVATMREAIASRS
jgi:very-short-patch-repair endonuclease